MGATYLEGEDAVRGADGYDDKGDTLEGRDTDMYILQDEKNKEGIHVKE
jgi:hypothetical protein